MTYVNGNHNLSLTSALHGRTHTAKLPAWKTRSFRPQSWFMNTVEEAGNRRYEKCGTFRRASEIQGWCGQQNSVCRRRDPYSQAPFLLSTLQGVVLYSEPGLLNSLGIITLKGLFRVTTWLTTVRKTLQCHPLSLSLLVVPALQTVSLPRASLHTG